MLPELFHDHCIATDEVRWIGFTVYLPVDDLEQLACRFDMTVTIETDHVDDNVSDDILPILR